jgi:hypothetical protein
MPAVSVKLLASQIQAHILELANYHACQHRWGEAAGQPQRHSVPATDRRCSGKSCLLRQLQVREWVAALRHVRVDPLPAVAARDRMIPQRRVDPCIQAVSKKKTIIERNSGVST